MGRREWHQSQSANWTANGENPIGLPSGKLNELTKPIVEALMTCPMWWTSSVCVCACGRERALAFEKLLQQKSDDAPRREICTVVSRISSRCANNARSRAAFTNTWNGHSQACAHACSLLLRLLLLLIPDMWRACVRVCVYVRASSASARRQRHNTLGGNRTGLDETAWRTKARLEGLY